MSNPIPSLLALTSIADGSPQQAAPIRNNYSAIQTASNEVIAALSGGASGQVLQAVDASHVQWGTRTTVSAITAGPPASPADGDIWIATGVDANGTRWQFQYNAGSASAYKWEFIGGSPLGSFQATDTNYSTTGAWTNFGVSVTTLRAGDYNAEIAARVYTGASGIAVDIGANGIYSPNNYVGGAGAAINTAFHMHHRWTQTGVAANTTWNLAYFLSSGSAFISEKSVYVTPVRVA